MYSNLFDVRSKSSKLFNDKFKKLFHGNDINLFFDKFKVVKLFGNFKTSNSLTNSFSRLFDRLSIFKFVKFPITSIKFRWIIILVDKKVNIKKNLLFCTSVIPLYDKSSFSNFLVPITISYVKL